MKSMQKLRRWILAGKLKVSNPEPVRFKIGDVVRIRDGQPNHHHRTPWFVKGKIARVVAICGTFHNPETRAYGDNESPMTPLYRVELSQGSVWEEYRNQPSDKLLIDIYQNWLIPA